MISIAFFYISNVPYSHGLQYNRCNITIQIKGHNTHRQRARNVDWQIDNYTQITCHYWHQTYEMNKREDTDIIQTNVMKCVIYKNELQITDLRKS